jgi:hypothetical protein
MSVHSSTMTQGTYKDTAPTEGVTCFVVLLVPTDPLADCIAQIDDETFPH